MILSKNKIKWIKSLELKKHRRESGLFVAEGHKLVIDNLHTMRCHTLVATEQWYAANPDAKAPEMYVASTQDLAKVSFLKTAQEVLAIFEMPKYKLSAADLSGKLTIALDTIQDPGNLGTIIRLADWFGIEDIVCSMETADCFAPKTVQATMGAIARVRVHYTNLVDFFDSLPAMPVYGTFLEGENIYNKELSSDGIIVMGNEGKGISAEVARKVNAKLHIPNYPADRPTSESLNVAIATSIICAEFRRRS